MDRREPRWGDVVSRSKDPSLPPSGPGEWHWNLAAGGWWPGRNGWKLLEPQGLWIYLGEPPLEEVWSELGYPIHKQRLPIFCCYCQCSPSARMIPLHVDALAAGPISCGTCEGLFVPR